MTDQDIVAPRRLLTRRFAAAFALIAALLLANQLAIRPSLLRLTTDAPVLNVAGRQRMLSQRLAKAALALAAAEDAAVQDRRRAELRGVLALWSASHDGLRGGDPALSLPGNDPPEVRAAFDGLEPYFRRMKDAAATLAAGSDRDAETAATVAILANESEYLPRMDRIVGLYEADARARVDRLRWTGWAVTGLVAAALAAIGLFVLDPAANLIERQMAAVREARDRLEDRVRERTAELERANRELDEEHRRRAAAEAKQRELLEQVGRAGRVNALGELATELAHELNQPLGAAANYVEGCLVSLDSDRPDLPAVRDALGKALRTTLRAGEIIRRIRRFVARQEPAREDVDPNRLAGEVREFLADAAERRGVTIETALAPDLPSVRCDSVQIQQVLVNLVQNAVEAVASSEHASRRVVIETAAGVPAGVEFRVTDRGPGIEPDRIGRVFDAFHSTRADGLGMGLAISRSIVEAHGGRIAAESEPGVRTTFRFTLPTEPPTDRPGSTPASA